MTSSNPTTNNSIYSHIVGRDVGPTPVKERLTDWFADWLYRNPPSARPNTVREFLTKVLPHQTWVPFAVGDGTFMRYSEENKHIDRQLRFIIVSTPEKPSDPPKDFPRDAPIGNVDDVVKHAFCAQQTVCVVGGPMFDNPDAFLQVASWDVIKRRLNFYQYASGTLRMWLYLGSSFDAFKSDTKGRGPFSGHVNGALVMKELSIPWIHWHSTSYSINRTFSRDDPIFDDPLLQPPGACQLSYIARADRFEKIVRNATIAWYNSRWEQDFGPGGSPRPTALNSWMRHVLTTTTINIAGSSIDCEEGDAGSSIDCEEGDAGSSTACEVVLRDKGDARIPDGFFFNDRVIRDMLPHDIEIPRLGEVKSAYYNAARIGMGLKTIYKWNFEPDAVGVASACVASGCEGSECEGSGCEGQTPWCVLVPSLDDIEGIRNITRAGLLSEAEILAFLMIDFPNPIYSLSREQLLRYVPQTLSISEGLIASIEASIRAIPNPSSATLNRSSPEFQLLLNISQARTSPSEFKRTCASRIAAYMTKVAARLNTAAGVKDYMLLAESRRRLFRPLASSQDASTNPLPGFYEMTEEGRVPVPLRLLPKPSQPFNLLALPYAMRFDEILERTEEGEPIPSSQGASTPPPATGLDGNEQHLEMTEEGRVHVPFKLVHKPSQPFNLEMTEEGTVRLRRKASQPFN